MAKKERQYDFLGFMGECAFFLEVRAYVEHTLLSKKGFFFFFKHQSNVRFVN